ncbi:SCO7613 C-terminal domain-containing membrane protein [Streptomyces sp. NPDC004726]
MTTLPPPLPPAEELVILDRELVRLDARRTQLLARRAWLLAVLQPPVAPPGGGRAFAVPPVAGRPGETSSPSVQNLLLALGGTLLTIAAIAFTLVSWGEMGIGGRSAVLGTVTVAALAAPVALLRRNLSSTAEAVAALGLALTVLDAYALHRVALPDRDGLAYSAWASAVLAMLWAAYGIRLRPLRLPLPVAVAAAQLPLVLWAVTADLDAIPLEWALLATAAFDVVVALWAKPTSVRALATVTAWTAGCWALLLGLLQSAVAEAPSDALRAAVLLVVGAAVALFAARRAPSAAEAPSVVAGLALVAGVGGVVREVFPGGWAVPAYVLCGAALSAVVGLVLVRSGPPGRSAAGLAAASAAVHALAALTVLPLLVLSLVSPVTILPDLWEGPPSNLRDALGADISGVSAASVPVTLLMMAGVLAVYARRTAAPGPEEVRTADSAAQAPAAAAGAGGAEEARPENIQPEKARPEKAQPEKVRPEKVRAEKVWAEEAHSERPAPTTGPVGGPEGGTGTGWGVRTPAASAPVRLSEAGKRAAAGGAAIGLGWGALVTAPVAFGAGYPAAVAFLLFIALGAIALTTRPEWTARRAPAAVGVALGCGLTGAVSLGLLSLATRPATFTVLGTLAVALTAAAVVSRAPYAVRSILASAAAVFWTWLLIAVSEAAGLESPQTGLVVLLVPATVAVVVSRPPAAPGRLTVPLEATGAAVGLLGAVLAAEHGPTLALVLALGGVIAVGTAIRPERRQAASYTAAVLFVLAAWVRLAASEVTVPEAYTLPVTVPALAVGVLRRRRDADASSWAAYGPGLAATLLPSLATAWGDEHWIRPLLLGVAALVVTLVGARLRLQALLVLGGAVLALVALHELAPYVVQVVGALPRWLPPALAGLLLLGVGATYEQRLRDARRLRDTLGRMH